MKKKLIARWMRAIYPVFLPVLLLLGTVIIFYGNLGLKNISNSQKSIIQKLDLLEWQLFHAGSPKNRSKKTLTISLQTSDRDNFEIKEYSNTRNISPVAQLALARKILNLGAEKIYLHWFYYREVWQTDLKNLKSLVKDNPAITLITSFDQAQALRESFENKLQILVSDFCNGKRRTICPYNPKWSFLAIQHFAVNYGQLNSSKLSSSLPNPLKSYIMRPIDKNQLDKKTYSDIIKLEKNDVQGKIVFMGSDLIQGAPGMILPEDVGRIPSLFQVDNNPVRTLGIPVHEYFASIVESILSADWIQVASKPFENTLRVFAPFSVILMVLNFGVTAGTCFFLGSSLLLILGNILFIKYFTFYIPDYDSVFLASLALIGSGYMKNSIEQFEFALVHNRKKALENNTDLKSNFISLFSHNLNTPIAKIRGLINSLEKSSPEHQEVFNDMNVHLTDMQTAIKATLTKTRLEDNYIHLELLNREKLREEITFEILPLMKRRFIDFSFEIDIDNGFYEDKKLLTALISSVSIFTPKNSKVWFSLSCADDTLTLEWICTEQVLAWKNLSNMKSDVIQVNSLESFISLYSEKRAASLSYLDEDGGSQLTLQLKSASRSEEPLTVSAERL